MESIDNFGEGWRNFTALTMHATFFPYVPNEVAPSRSLLVPRNPFRRSLFSKWFSFDPFGFDFRRCFALNKSRAVSGGRSQGAEPSQGEIDKSRDFDLEALPDELLCAVLNRLPTLFELLRCSRVSHRWRRLIEQSCLAKRRELSRRTLLPAFADGQHDPWKAAAESIQPLLFYARPFVPPRMLKILLKKIAPHLTHLSFDTLRNECSECPRCREVKDTIAYHPLIVNSNSANDAQQIAEWIEAIELEAESQCKVEGGMSGVLLDEEAVGILATSATRLRHLNLFGVRFTTPECEFSLCTGLRDRVETLVLGERGGWNPRTRVELSQFLTAFTRLQRLTILLYSCIDRRKTIYAALPPPMRLPQTLVELKLLACWVDIDARLADLLVEECPALRTLAICVATTVDYRSLNRICARLEKLELHFYKFDIGVPQGPQNTNLLGDLRFIPSIGHNGEAAAKFNAPSLQCLKVLGECAVPSSHLQQMGHFLQVVFDGLVLNSKRLTDLQINLLSLEQLHSADHATLRDGSIQPSLIVPWLWPIGEQLSRLTTLKRLESWGASVDGAALEGLAREGMLRELSLRGCAGSNLLRGICAVVMKCESLHRLTIAQCGGIESSALFGCLCGCLDAIRGGNRPHPAALFGTNAHRFQPARSLLFADGECKEVNMHPWIVRVAPRWHAEVTSQSLLELDSERLRQEMWTMVE